MKGDSSRAISSKSVAWSILEPLNDPLTNQLYPPRPDTAKSEFTCCFAVRLYPPLPLDGALPAPLPTLFDGGLGALYPPRPLWTMLDEADVLKAMAVETMVIGMTRMKEGMMLKIVACG